MADKSNWIDFEKDDWNDLITERNLRNCLRISTKIKEGEGKWSGLHSLHFPIPTKKEIESGRSAFIPSSPNPSAEIHTLSTYDKTVNSYHESGYDVTSANMGVPGIASGSVTTKEEHSHEETFAETDVYVTALYKVPKLRLLFDRDAIELDPAFVKAIREALEKGEKEGRGTGEQGVAEFKDMYLREVLDKYGHYVVTDVSLGGLLRATSTTKVTSHKEAEEYSRSVKTSFSADLSAFDVPLSGGAGNEHGSSHGESHEEEHRKVTLDVTSIGGDPGKIKQYPEWAESLGPFHQWHIIRTGGLVPVIDLLPPDLGREVAAAIVAAEGYMDYCSTIENRVSSILDD